MRFSFFRKAIFTPLLAFLFVIPLPSAAAPAELQDPAPVWRYTVKPGDNLINIAQRYFIRSDQWPKVQRANRIEDPLRMMPGSVLRIPVGLLRQAPAAAVLESINGAVRWRTGDADWQTARSGLRLASGAALETQEDSSALLVLADGSRILVAPNSQIVLDMLSLYAGGLMADTRMRLQRGQADITANPEQRPNRNLKIQTPSAQAVVRGTRFRLGVVDDVTHEETIGGLVHVRSAGRSVSVPQDRGTVARAGEAPMEPVALLEAVDVSALPDRFEQLPMRFPLPRLAGVTEWRGQIAPDASFERILLGKSTRGESLTFADLPNGNYALRLRAVDAHGLQGLDAVHRFTVFARPFPPGLQSPGDLATIRTAKARFVWRNVLDVAHYRIQVSVAPDFSAPLYDETLGGDAWEAPEELPEGKLYWRAASVGGDGQQGPWNVAAAFTYKRGPGAADLGRMALQIDSEKIGLKLSPPPDGLFYEAILATEKELAPVLAQARSDDGWLELQRPDSGSYHLGVRLVDRDDNTPGPISIQKIEIPPSRLWLLLLLVPLAL